MSIFFTCFKFQKPCYQAWGAFPWKHIAAPRVVRFAQTHHHNARQIPRQNKIIGRTRSVPKHDTYKDYVRYAEHCLNMVAATTDQESRSVRRDMAAEWLRLADAIRRPRKSWQIHPLKSRPTG